MWKSMIASTLLIGACWSGDDPGAPLDHGGFLEEPGMQIQSRHLLGETYDDLAGAEPRFHASVAPATAVDAAGRPIALELHGGAALRSGDHRGKDPFFDGVIVATDDGGEVELSIDRDTPGGKDVAAYRLRFRERPGAEWRDPCRGLGALPLAGVWRRTGTHELDPQRITFACADGTAYKCVKWGYVPGADPSSVGWRAHQACTRMARADYCGNGTSHTREGTGIWIYDNLGIARRPSTSPSEFKGLDRYPPPPDQPTFEAAWPIGDGPAGCLGRLRWQTLPLHGACAEATTLPHPRDAVGAYCDDLGADDSDGAAPMLFNSSTYSDLALHVWKRGDDRVSTVRGYHDPSLPDDVRGPFAGLGSYEHEELSDALLFRKLTGAVDAAGFVEVHMYRHPASNDHVIASSSDRPPGFDSLGFEGFVLRARPNASFRAFKLYRHATTGDLWSTTLEAEAVAAGYVEPSLIGYLPPPES
jgi:hypothetical protein